MNILHFGFSISLPFSTNSKRNPFGFGNQKPRNLCQNEFRFNSLKTQNCYDAHLLKLKFGRGMSKKRKRFNLVRLKSVVDVDKAVEGVGSLVGDANSSFYDAIVIGSGIGGLVAATQLAVKGAKVLVLEKYVIPGGSSGFYQRDGFTFDVGSSVMFGFSDKGNLNLITQALATVGCKMQVIPDPTTVHYHLPNSLSVKVHKEYDEFITELVSKFPHEKEGILKFYGDCWKIFNALNSLELKSLEEPIYLFGQFFKKPLECLTLGVSRKVYGTKKELMSEKIISRLEKKLFPGLKSSIVFMQLSKL